jgi:hypothetical protein
MAAWVPTAPAIIAVFICEAVRWNRLMPWTSSSIHTATVRPNRDGHGMLPMSPPGHHRVGLAFREICCSVAALRQSAVSRRLRFTDFKRFGNRLSSPMPVKRFALDCLRDHHLDRDGLARADHPGSPERETSEPAGR